MTWFPSNLKFWSFLKWKEWNWSKWWLHVSVSIPKCRSLGLWWWWDLGWVQYRWIWYSSMMIYRSRWEGGLEGWRCRPKCVALSLSFEMCVNMKRGACTNREKMGCRIEKKRTLRLSRLELELEPVCWFLVPQCLHQICIYFHRKHKINKDIMENTNFSCWYKA